MEVREYVRPIIEKSPSSMEALFDMIDDDLEKVDREFCRNLGSTVSIISDIGQYLRSSGGKRFRAKLLLLSAKLCGYRGPHHIVMASLIEFIHTATLLHDDVVDRAELRRGLRSANRIWGDEACVLVGDFFFTKCFSQAVEIGNMKILQTISRATMLMAEGELEELMKTKDLSLPEEEYLSIITRKTAFLISAATQVGAILGQATEEEEEALTEFGMTLGIAFQLTDDLLDYTSREEEFGKKIGIDLQDGKITLPLIATLHRCTEKERALIHETVTAPQVTREAFGRVVNIMEQYQGVQYTWEKAKDYTERAKDCLKVFPSSQGREALSAMADYILNRKL